MTNPWPPFLTKFIIFRSISGPKLEAKGPEKVENKWNWVLEALWVSVPLLGSIKVTFTLNDGPLVAIFDKIRNFQGYAGPGSRGQRSIEDSK